MSENFPIDSDLIEPMYKLTLQFLLQSEQLPTDKENNASDVQYRAAIQ